MTKIQYTELCGGFALECSGHAGYAKNGDDIVCAGVSALCAALAEAVDEAADEGLTERHMVEESDGYFRAEAYCGEDDYAERYLGAIFRTVYLGLNAIADAYPAYAQVD